MEKKTVVAIVSAVLVAVVGVVTAVGVDLSPVISSICPK